MRGGECVGEICAHLCSNAGKTHGMGDVFIQSECDFSKEKRDSKAAENASGHQSNLSACLFCKRQHKNEGAAIHLGGGPSRWSVEVLRVSGAEDGEQETGQEGDEG